MTKHDIITIDLGFQGIPKAIAVYMVPHHQGVALFECGPGSTVPQLEGGLREYGYNLDQITDVFLTHIHLDHAGAAGRLARQGARIHVHPQGAPHLVDPTKLLASASRIYGAQMDLLWGEFLPVPIEQISSLEDSAIVDLAPYRIMALDTPGHANHHLAYQLDAACFTGDIGGVRLSETDPISLPMPPPEFHLEQWRNSLERLLHIPLKWIIPTHFGIYDDPQSHLTSLLAALDEIELWMQSVMPAEPALDDLRRQFIEFERDRRIKQGLNPEHVNAQMVANPPFMSADGIQRYWRKYRI